MNDKPAGTTPAHDGVFVDIDETAEALLKKIEAIPAGVDHEFHALAAELRARLLKVTL